MVRFQRRDTQKARAAIQSLSRESRKKKGTYNTPEVNDALQEMFFQKCYLCESKNVTAYAIEHLVSAGEDPRLRYDWNNLFLACAHCNGTKKKRHEPILDCTRTEVDRVIRFYKKGHWGTEERFCFEAREHSEEVLHTIALLEEIYYGRTPQKKIESARLRESLRKELAQFKEYVRSYLEADGEDRRDLYLLIQRELSARSAFTAFKRWLIWDNGAALGELVELCG
ncbi:MAG: HNH endonuclease [Acetatifactor muris]|nr:HNH endonuclease [Acetatifactor muris]